MHTFKEVAAMLAQRAEDVAKMLYAEGKKSGSEFCIGDIVGTPGESLKIHLTGNKAGVWTDFANPGTGGDLIDLWAKRYNINKRDALKEASKWLGLELQKFEYKQPKIYKKLAPLNLTTLDPKSPVMRYLTEKRLLSFNTLELFKISESNNNIVFPYLRDNELIQKKYLSLERHGDNHKKKFHVETDCEPCLFGWHLIPPDMTEITIAEGEIDAMTLTQYGIPALSIPFGANAHQWLENDFDRLSSFNEIFICFDQDEEGRKATLQVVERLGRHRCRAVELPYKDANECLQQKLTPEEMRAIFKNAKTLDPEELKRASSFVQEVIHEFYPSDGEELGISPPWNKAKGKILFRPDELSTWTGINGHGKSQFLGQIILKSMKEGARVCIASLELKPKRLLHRLTRQAAGLVLPHENYIQAIHEWYDDKLWLFDLLGSAKTSRLLEVFTYARKKYGVTVFVIDSFMKLDIDEEDLKRQKQFIEKLCDFKNEYNCHVHVIVHPRKNFDENHQPNKLDIKGTGAISDLADNCFVIWRNKFKEREVDKVEKNIGYVGDSDILSQPDCYWTCDKQRNGDWEGKLGFWFDKKSLQYLEHPEQKTISYVDYSRLDN